MSAKIIMILLVESIRGVILHKVYTNWIRGSYKFTPNIASILNTLNNNALLKILRTTKMDYIWKFTRKNKHKYFHPTKYLIYICYTILDHKIIKYYSSDYVLLSYLVIVLWIDSTFLASWRQECSTDITVNSSLKY